MPRRPSIDSSIALSSPHTYEPAPTTTCTFIPRASIASSRRAREVAYSSRR